MDHNTQTMITRRNFIKQSMILRKLVEDDSTGTLQQPAPIGYISVTRSFQYLNTL